MPNPKSGNYNYRYNRINPNRNTDSYRAYFSNIDTYRYFPNRYNSNLTTPVSFNKEDNQEPYVYHSQLSHSSDDIKGFKYGETYRLGIQLINEYGREADIIFLGDYEVATPPSMKYNSDLGADTLQKTYISVDISSINKDALKSLGFNFILILSAYIVLTPCVMLERPTKYTSLGLPSLLG